MGSGFAVSNDHGRSLPDISIIMTLLTKFKDTISKYHMLSPGDRVVVAVSGGPDSVSLLRALLSFAPEYGLTLHIAHLDHRFRGSESAAEAMFVADLARTLGLRATVEGRDVPAYCAERGLSAQAGGREVRYRFLRQVAESVGANRIALGHTANDQAETLLMRLIRGAGASGLAAAICSASRMAAGQSFASYASSNSFHSLPRSTAVGTCASSRDAARHTAATPRNVRLVEGSTHITGWERKGLGA